METEKRNPLLAKAFHLYHGKTRRLDIELAGNTLDDEIVSFRESLINVEKYGFTNLMTPGRADRTGACPTQRPRNDD